MNDLSDKVQQYIDKRRTISLENLCCYFGVDNTVLKPVINNLEQNNRVRIVNSACSLDCSSCSTCGENAEDRLLYSTIIISLNLITL